MKVLVHTGASMTLVFPSDSGVEFDDALFEGQSTGLAGLTAIRSGRTRCDVQVGGARLGQPPVAVNPSLRSALIGVDWLGRWAVSFDQNSSLIRLQSSGIAPGS